MPIPNWESAFSFLHIRVSETASQLQIQYLSF